ncbi:TraR/DksA family transcriptional regulator [Actinomadura livida]|uniref:DnaK suppressor protein n=1 Tax=Actinomadura livida TaxID=79909 RepID=A0A7W7IE69_9ACTN|nr:MULTISPECIES: TraR/DksA C4-type zinc finger protein [Actinomadura]MBB4775381.1 DnaK suppressor protein [Actinomadura catellatispora]GGT89938.1 molecular chaperone DnaK [Actinomadura livida]
MTVNSAVNDASGYPPDGARARRARELLQEERRTRVAQLTVLEHAEDAAPDQGTLARRESLQSTLEEIDAALARLDDGTYGLCEDCGEPVPEGRLEIIPYARRCVQCQQRRR